MNNIERALEAFEVIRKECGLLRNPIEGVREASVQIVEMWCKTGIDALEDEQADIYANHDVK